MRCRYCGDPNPGVLHLFAKGPAPSLQVGSLVVAKKATDTCDPGQVGVVFEEYRLHDRAAWESSSKAAATTVSMPVRSSGS